MDVDSIVAAFQQSRCSVERLVAPAQPGVYAYYLRDQLALQPLRPSLDGLIYVGLASNLARREFENHLNSTATGSSTLRRSLGAILKQSLQLVAIPRSSGPTESNVRNFRFLADGEERLTGWMQQNLEVAICAVDDPAAVEIWLIAELHPILNLKGWSNAARKNIRALRKLCADEARAARQEIEE